MNKVTGLLTIASTQLDIVNCHRLCGNINKVKLHGILPVLLITEFVKYSKRPLSHDGNKPNDKIANVLVSFSKLPL